MTQALPLINFHAAHHIMKNHTLLFSDFYVMFAFLKGRKFRNNPGKFMQATADV